MVCLRIKAMKEDRNPSMVATRRDASYNFQALMYTQF